MIMYLVQTEMRARYCQCSVSSRLSVGHRSRMHILRGTSISNVLCPYFLYI